MDNESVATIQHLIDTDSGGSVAAALTDFLLEYTNYKARAQALENTLASGLAERKELRALVELARRVIDRRDPEQWSLNHDAFVDLGVALDRFDGSGAEERDDAAVDEWNRLRAALARLRRYWDEVQAGTVEGGALGVIEMALRDAGRLDGSGVIGGHVRQGPGRQKWSDACLHEAHGECDEVCAWCDDRCACACHDEKFARDDALADHDDEDENDDDASEPRTPEEWADWGCWSEAEDEPRPRVVRNAARCRRCGVTVESRHRHDFVTCSCGAISVDGGFDYIRRVGDRADIEELSEWSTGGGDDDPIDGYHPTLDGPAYSQTDAALDEPMTGAELNRWSTEQAGKHWFGGGVSDGGQELNPDTSRSPRPTGAPRQRAEFSDEQYRNHGDERSIDGSS